MAVEAMRIGAFTVMANVPADVGVPARLPALLRLIPAGNAPELIAKVYGAMPPLAVRARL